MVIAFKGKEGGMLSLNCIPKSSITYLATTVKVVEDCSISSVKASAVLSSSNAIKFTIDDDATEVGASVVLDL